MKDIILKLVTGILFITGIGELAISQIHIEASTKIFANQIGFYLFLFIIFGMTTAFNGMLLEKLRSVLLFVLSGLLAAWAGFRYIRLLQADVAAQDGLSMADVQTSFTLVIVSVVIYLISVFVVPLLKWEEIKLAESL